MGQENELANDPDQWFERVIRGSSAESAEWHTVSSADPQEALQHFLSRTSFFISNVELEIRTFFWNFFAYARLLSCQTSIKRNPLKLPNDKGICTFDGTWVLRTFKRLKVSDSSVKSFTFRLKGIFSEKHFGSNGIWPALESLGSFRFYSLEMNVGRRWKLSDSLESGFG